MDKDRHLILIEPLKPDKTRYFCVDSIDSRKQLLLIIKLVKIHLLKYSTTPPNRYNLKTKQLCKIRNTGTPCALEFDFNLLLTLEQLSNEIVLYVQ